MKFALSIIFIITAFQLTAQAADESIVVTEVTVETPLPTGLESAPARKPEGKALIAKIFSNKKSKYIIDAVYKKNQAIIDRNTKLDGAFYQQGSARIDCNKSLVRFFQEDDRYCEFVASKSFGWYADIELGIKVKGYVLKTEIPASAQNHDGFYFVY